MTAKKKTIPKHLEDLDETLSLLIEQLHKELKTVKATSVGGKLKRFKLRNVLKYLGNAKEVLKA